MDQQGKNVCFRVRVCVSVCVCMFSRVCISVCVLSCVGVLHRRRKKKDGKEMSSSQKFHPSVKVSARGPGCVHSWCGSQVTFGTLRVGHNLLLDNRSVVQVSIFLCVCVHTPFTHLTSPVSLDNSYRLHTSTAMRHTCLPQ